MSGSEAEIAVRLCHRILIQAPDDTPDEAGGASRGWSDLGEAWAEVTPVSAEESLRFEQLSSRVSHRVLLRWRADVTPGMRIVMEGRMLSIQAMIDNGERKISLTLFCAEERQ